MESDADQVQAQLREIERGEAASWVHYPPTPWWWPGLFATYAAVLVLINGLADQPWKTIGSLGLVGVAFGIIVWDRRRRGAYPARKAPPELTAPFAWLGLMVVGLVVVGSFAFWWLGAWASAALVFVLTYAAVSTYERLYAGAAARARARLG